MIEVRQHLLNLPELLLVVVDHDDILDDQTLDAGGRCLLRAAPTARPARGQRHESDRADVGREDRLDERGCVRGRNVVQSERLRYQHALFVEDPVQLFKRVDVDEIALFTIAEAVRPEYGVHGLLNRDVVQTDRHGAAHVFAEDDVPPAVEQELLQHHIEVAVLDVHLDNAFRRDRHIQVLLQKRGLGCRGWFGIRRIGQPGPLRVSAVLSLNHGHRDDAHAQSQPSQMYRCPKCSPNHHEVNSFSTLHSSPGSRSRAVPLVIDPVQFLCRLRTLVLPCSS